MKKEVDMKKWVRLLLIAIVLSVATLILWFFPFKIWGDNIQAIDSFLQIPMSIVTIISWIWGFNVKTQEDPETTIKAEIKTWINGNQITKSDKGSVAAKTIKDSNITIINLDGKNFLKELNVPKKSDLEEATKRYNQFMYERFRYLEFRGMGINERIPLKMPLLNLYVPLHARREMPEFEKAERRQSVLAMVGGRDILDENGVPRIYSDTEPILDILQKHSSLVILGDPGSGKSTLMKWLTLIMATGQAKDIGLLDRLPILLSLSSYAKELENGLDCPLDEYLSTRFIKQISSMFPIKELYRTTLEKGRALILLDGLDEVRDVTLRQEIINRVQNFHAFHCTKGNQFILTSRIVGYKDVRLSGKDLQEITLVDFDDDQIEDFVTRWTNVIEHLAQENTDLAQQAADHERIELLEAVQRNPGVRQLAVNPLLLTILCSMKRQGVSLPERRVQLYDKYIEVLLSQWNQARSIDGNKPSRNLNVVQAVRLLAPLALWMHEHSAGIGMVKTQDLRRELVRLFTEKGEQEAEAATDQFLDDVRNYACLLVERGEGEYGFLHLTFEEYLAGVGIALAGQGNAETIAEKIGATVDESVWRESSLLAIAYVTLIQQLEDVAGKILSWLVTHKPGQSGNAVLLAGEALVDAGQDALPAVVRDEVITALVPVMQSKDKPAETRHRCGIAVSTLGWRLKDLDWFMPIPAGEFLYGDEDENKKLEEKKIPYNFWIAKYPVTNHQYQRFMDANGYENEDWWGKEGKKWLKDSTRMQPRIWNSTGYNAALQPVIGVTWFEAEAYCNWVNNNYQRDGVLTPTGNIKIPDGYKLRLPLEWEWEYAARGQDGRMYPWGNHFTKEFTNTLESGLIITSVVSTYPDGASPFEVWDMSGNVWEWQENIYGKEQNARVLRGGSWNNFGGDARCAFRGRYDPDLDAILIGFRIILSRSSSDPEF
jgi:formylglycine-generating enzyme required for sulfatase activity/energy-coupling factor transporter ATP-binding protein EcfA2